MAAVLALALGATAPLAQSSLDDAFAVYWGASNRVEVGAAGERILSLDPAFDELLRRLEAGPRFDLDAATGSLMMERRNADGSRYPFLVIVPDDYDPARSYPLRAYLHGGVNRPLRDSDGGWWRNPQRVADSQHIAVFPYSWDEVVVVAREPGREPGGHPLATQTHLQHRRQPGRDVRCFGRRNGRLVFCLSRHHTVGGVSAVHRASRGAVEPTRRRRRRYVSDQPYATRRSMSSTGGKIASTRWMRSRLS